MPEQTQACELKNDDIIDIITHDENNRRNIRRVRVLNLDNRRPDKYVFAGVNMQGGNPRIYHVQKMPCDPDTLRRHYESIGWIPFDDTAEADE